MAMSRSKRVSIMLFFSTILFFLELIVGLIAGSIALVADSFHMLNDVLSLIIALYAIHLSKQRDFNPLNTYGWQRSEILGALMNAVLLLGLCLTIYIESFQRFFILVEIDHPQLVLAVGGIGLAFNIIGMYMFGDAHSHQAHGHSHTHTHSSSHGEAETQKTKPIMSTPQTPLSTGIAKPPGGDLSVNNYGAISENEALLADSTFRTSSNAQNTLRTSSPSSESDSSPSLDNLRPQTDYPATTKFAIVESAEYMKRLNVETDSSLSGAPLSVLSRNINPHTSTPSGHHDDGKHNHSGNSNPSGHLNMHGVWLHVLGDCLANIAVIISALFIWLTPFDWRFYMDPFISIFINTMIVYFTIPLVKSASFILMQGVPLSMDIHKIHHDLSKLDYVFNVHELHVWQLSDTKVVASVHLIISKYENYTRKSAAAGINVLKYVTSNLELSEIYMQVAAAANKVLHKHGVHSTTIQPEFMAVNFDNQIDDTDQQFGDILSVSDKARTKKHEFLAATSDSTNFKAKETSVPVERSDLQNSLESRAHLGITPGSQLTVPVNKSKVACLLSCKGNECGELMCCSDNIFTPGMPDSSV